MRFRDFLPGQRATQTWGTDLTDHNRQWLADRQADVDSLRRKASTLAVLAADYPRASGRAEDLLTRLQLTTARADQAERRLRFDQAVEAARQETWGLNRGHSSATEEGRGR